METALWVTLKMAVNRDVARIPNLFRQVGRIKNEFRPKVGVFLIALENTQVDSHTQFVQRAINKARVSRLVASHVAEEFCNLWIPDFALDFLIQNTARVLGRY